MAKHLFLQPGICDSNNCVLITVIKVFCYSKEDATFYCAMYICLF